MERAYIGADPGKKGGLAYLSDDTLEYCPMPESMKKLFEFFSVATGIGKPVTVIIEKVSAMPKQGVCSMFTFGMGFGALQMAAVASGCRLILVTPQEWKKVVLAGTDKTKDASICVCENLFPAAELVMPGCRKPHDGIAEAILMAEYGRRLNL